VTATCIVLGAIFPLQAQGDDRPPAAVDWDRLNEAIRGGGGAQVLGPDESVPRAGVPGSIWLPDMSRAASPSAPWTPDVSLVARDWGGARFFLGHLSTTDRVRVGRSSRMVVGRVRVTAGRFVPFAELGLGQWRLGSDLDVRRQEVSYATELGSGFELRLSSSATVAIEADHAFLLRETGWPTCARAWSSARPWVGLLAARARF
jgi:hypothetical protein